MRQCLHTCGMSLEITHMWHVSGNYTHVAVPLKITRIVCGSYTHVETSGNKGGCVSASGEGVLVTMGRVC